jgi:hypothetical protein
MNDRAARVALRPPAPCSRITEEERRAFERSAATLRDAGRRIGVS